MVWKTVWIMCITCCSEELQKKLCEPVEQMSERNFCREKMISFCRSGKFLKEIADKIIGKTGNLVFDRSTSPPASDNFASGAAEIQSVIAQALDGY